jgi:ferritin-like metal-binding protein YciE
MNLQEMFVEKLQEVAGAEKLLVAGLPALVDASSDAQLQAALAEHLEQTETQVTRIADVHASLRLKPKSRTCKPMAALVADGAKAALAKPAGEIRDLAMLGAAQRVEYFEIAVYLSTISLAKTLGYGDATNLLVENLLEEQKAADHLKKISKSLLERAQDEAFK